MIHAATAIGELDECRRSAGDGCARRLWCCGLGAGGCAGVGAWSGDADIVPDVGDPASDVGDALISGFLLLLAESAEELWDIAG